MPGSIRNRTMLVATLAGCFAVTGATLAQTQSATPAPPANPSAPIQSVTPPPPANPVQSATPAPLANPSLSSSPIQMPGSVPSKSETVGSAFGKLSSSQQYVTRDEAGKLDGFDRAFTEADRDKDGKLNQEEFAVAWAIYTGRT